MAVHARMGLATSQPIEPRARPRLVSGPVGLAAHGLGKQFRGRSVLRDVSVQVRRGEAVGLLGPNGAGKTTCFHIITGLLQADYGTVSLTTTTSPTCRCTGAPGSASAICRRRPRCSAA